MADRYLLESGSPDGYLLEDGSGVLLLDAVTPLSLTDNFDGNSIDGAKWTTGNLADPSATTTGVTVADTSQQLQITGPASTAAARYSGLVSVSTYDFTDHAIFVKIANAASIGSFQLAFLIAGVDVNNKYSVQISGGTFVQLLEIVAGGQTAASAQISVGSDVWFRLRHTSTGDQIIVDSAPSTASDPPVESDWTQRTALPRNSSVGAVTAWSVALNGGLFNSNATPTTIQFDGFNTATSGGTTVALTGQSLTAALGSLLASTALALTGQSLTVAQGTIGIGAALSGQSLSVAQGSTVAANSAALSGQSATVARGTITASPSLALSGQSLTAAQGTLSPSTAISLTGQASTIAQGSVTQSRSIALSGQGASLAQGSVSPAISVAIGGQSLAVTQGNLTAVIGVTAALTGQSLSIAQGSILPALTLTISGQALTVAGGIVSVASTDITAPITGHSISVALGSVTASVSDEHYKFWRQPPLTGRRTSPGRSR